MIRWKKKNETNGNLKTESNNSGIERNKDKESKDIESRLPDIDLDFKDEDDDYERNRKISKSEMAFKTIETAAKGYSKLRLGFKKFWWKMVKNTDYSTELINWAPDEDREKFRRLITFIFREEYLQEFISMTQALGFKKLGGFEYLGRRDADYSLSLDLDLIHRLHIRVYRIKDNVFVLAHHEPKANQDISLHIKGFFDRVLHEMAEKDAKKNDVKQNEFEKSTETDIDRRYRIQESFETKIELSNYEKGSEIIINLLKEKVPNFYRKINSEINNDILELWKEFLGDIDHLSPEKLIVEDLYESSRLIPPFSQIRDTVQKIFQYLNFETLPVWDLQVPASDKYFIAQTTYAKKEFKILVITDDLLDDLMRIIGLLRAKYDPKYVLLISPNISIFGPEPDDVPPDNVEIPPFNPDRVKEFINFMAGLKISIMPVSVLIDIFQRNLVTPIRNSHLALLLNNKGLIDSDMINEILRENDSYDKFLKDVLEIFNILRKTEKNKWISLKSLYKKAKNSDLELNQSEISNIIIFMENPLLGLIESKKGKRENYHVIPSLSDEDIDYKLELMKKMLQEYMIEQKPEINYFE